MGRPRRDLQSSTVFHVSNRGVDGQDIFFSDEDFRRFEREWERACDQHDVVVLAYAWMSNHFHVIVELRSPEDLPRVMAEVQSRYSTFFNWRTARSGPLFERRYWSKPITSTAQLIQNARYVHRNPISICGEERLAAYRHSSLPVYLGRREAVAWLDTSRLDGLIDTSRYLSQLIDTEVDDIVPLDALPASRTTNLEQLVRAVDVCLASRSVASREHRRLVAFLGLELRVADVVDLAAWLGVGPAAVRRLARLGRVQVDEEPGFGSLCQIVKLELVRRAT